MPSSPNKGYTQPTYNSEIGSWGTDVNDNLTGIVDLNVGGQVSIALSSTNVTLTTGATGQMQNLIVTLTGTLLTNVTVSSAAIGFYLVENRTTGSFTVTWAADFGSGAVGTSWVIPQGASGLFFSDTTYGARCLNWMPLILAATSGFAPAILRRTENDTTARKALSIQSGLGSGDDYAIYETGDASSNVATVTEQIGSTVIGTKTTSLQSFAIPAAFTVVQSANPLVTAQGRLTLLSGTPVLSTDVASATTVYWTPYTGNLIPIWDGSSFVCLPFSEIAITLTSALGANAIVDVFAAVDSGVVVAGLGPAWANSGAGTGARGTGAGTTQLVRANGILTNAVPITLINGATSYSSIPVNQATYLGSLYGDAITGQVSCLLSFGQSRKWGVWNAYNRKLIMLQAGDSTASWAYSSATWRPSNNNSANALTVFTALPEEGASIEFLQSVNGASGGSEIILNGVGINSTTAPSGKSGTSTVVSSASGAGSDLSARVLLAPLLGINQATCLESTGNTSVYSGTAARMVLSAIYMG
jgi:hypothetical protein